MRWRVAVAVWLREQGRCFYCDRAVTPEGAVMDHWVPVAAGGGDGFDNLRLACVGCNAWKGDKDPYEVIFDMRCTPPIWVK